MTFDFSFRTAESRRDRDLLFGYIDGQDLGYPNYHDWTHRTYFELEIGYKTGIIAKSNSVVVGDLIFQPDKTHKRVRELKNMRIHPDLRGRGFARFMLAQAERGLGEDFDMLLCDVPETETSTILFMEACGYKRIARIPIYSDDRREVVMVKAAKVGNK